MHVSRKWMVWIFVTFSYVGPDAPTDHSYFVSLRESFGGNNDENPWTLFDGRVTRRLSLSVPQLFASAHITEAHYCLECKKIVPCLHLTLGLPVGVRTSLPSPLSADLVVKCPVCRVINKFPFHQPNLYHDNPALCVVCQDRNVEVFLPNCGHAKLCRPCTVKLSES